MKCPLCGKEEEEEGWTKQLQLHLMKDHKLGDFITYFTTGIYSHYSRSYLLKKWSLLDFINYTMDVAKLSPPLEEMEVLILDRFYSDGVVVIYDKEKIKALLTLKTQPFFRTLPKEEIEWKDFIVRLLHKSYYEYNSKIGFPVWRTILDEKEEIELLSLSVLYLEDVNSNSKIQ